ncbi:hypothetical protein D3C86_2177800 [compost metagenome]
MFVRLPGQASTIIGLMASVLACIWYVCVQARWLKSALEKPWWNTLLSTLWVLAVGVVINTLAALLLLAF